MPQGSSGSRVSLQPKAGDQKGVTLKEATQLFSIPVFVPKQRQKQTTKPQLESVIYTDTHRIVSQRRGSLQTK